MRGLRTHSESSLQKRKKAGLGVGEGADYKPAIPVQHFSSSAPQTRAPVASLGRTSHVHSGLERNLLLKLLFESNLLLFRDQQPMDRPITLGIAEQLRVDHPTYPQSNTPVILTLDAMTRWLESNGEPFTAGWDVKPKSELDNPRVQEKLSISRAYCAVMGMPHFIFTEETASEDYIKNIDWLWASRPRKAEDLPVPDFFIRHPREMAQELARGQHYPTVLEYCQSYEQRHALPKNNGLRIFKHLVWQHAVKVDMTLPDVPTHRLPTPQSVSLINRFGVSLQ